MLGELGRRGWGVRAGKSDGLLRQRLAGLLLVLALHAGVFYALWSARLLPAPTDTATLFVSFIAPPEEKKSPELQRAPVPPSKQQQRPVAPPQPRQLVAETPVTAPTDPVAPAPPPKPIQAPVVLAPAPVAAAPVPAIAAPLPVGPVALSSELSVICPHHPDRRYPNMSIRLGEEGRVVVQVELSETGQITSAQVQSSSGFERLDNAALAAVRTWRCTPATRNGQPVRATALQPFKFEFKGN